MIATIIGTGLIGGSLAITPEGKRAWRSGSSGWTRTRSTCNGALELNIIDEGATLEDAMNRSSLANTSHFRWMPLLQALPAITG